MHGTKLLDNAEAADLYVYRKAEVKSIQIGMISRVLKQIAIDCILNKGQTNFTEKNMNQILSITLSNGKIINYSVGDKPYSSFCDYMESCEYTCQPTKIIQPRLDLYDEEFLIKKDKSN